VSSGNRRSVRSSASRAEDPVRAGADIAGELFLSRHTIRDHLKAIFEKVGVSSRGELASKLFAGHYHAPLNVAIYATADRVAARAAAAD